MPLDFATADEIMREYAAAALREKAGILEQGPSLFSAFDPELRALELATAEKLRAEADGLEGR